MMHENLKHSAPKGIKTMEKAVHGDTHLQLQLLRQEDLKF